MAQGGQRFFAEFSDDEGYAGSPGVSECCPQVPIEIEACEKLPRGTDIAFDDRADAQHWLFALSTAGLKIYPRPNADLKSSFGFRREELIYIPKNKMGPKQPDQPGRIVRPGRIALSFDLSRIAIGDVDYPQLIVLVKEGREYRFDRTFRVPERLLSEKGVTQSNQGRLFFANPVWQAAGNQISLAAFGYFPNRSLKGKGMADPTNNVVVFNYENADDVRFKEVAGEHDLFLYVSQLFDRSASPKTVYISTERIGVVGPTDLKSAPPELIAESRSVSFRRFDEYDLYRLILDQKNNFYFSTLIDSRYALFDVDFENLSVKEPRYFDDESEMRAQTSNLLRSNSTFFFRDLKDTDTWGYDREIGDASPVFFGRPLSVRNLNDLEVSRSAIEVPQLAGVAEPKMLVWGTDHAIRVISDERKIVCTRLTNSEALRMNITADGQFLVVAHGDGVIRWYALGVGQPNCLPLILSFYITKNAQGGWGYLAWLPDGRYATGGGVATRELACYPVELSDQPATCVDFQRDLSRYAPAAVRNALREARRLRSPQKATSNSGSVDGPRRAGWPLRGIGVVGSAYGAETRGVRFIDIERAEGARLDTELLDSVARTAQQEAISVDVNVPTQIGEDIPAQVTVSGWNDGKPRYLKFRANERDVRITYNGVPYAEGKSIAVNSSDKLALTLALPKVVQTTNSNPFRLCPFVYGAVHDDGTPDEQTMVVLANKEPCLSIKWTKATGQNNAPKVKLWAFLIGFSKATVNPLRYAHEDALDFAWFLAQDFRHRLKEPADSGSAAFDDIKIVLFIAPPGDYNPNSIKNNKKVSRIRDNLGDEKLDVVYMLPEQKDGFHGRILNKIGELKEKLAVEEADKNKIERWEHEFLIYFAGHGSSRNKPYLEFETPSVDENRNFGFLKFDDVVDALNVSGARYVRRIFIVDACRTVPGQEVSDLGDPEFEVLRGYTNMTTTHSKWDYFFSTRSGGYSYETDKFGIGDLIPGFELWPADPTDTSTIVEKSGNGLFTLGLLTSLICGDALDYPAKYNVEDSSKYLTNHFFSPRNPKWVDYEKELIPQLARRDIEYVEPEPQYRNVAADNRPFVFRHLESRPKRCFR